MDRPGDLGWVVQAHGEVYAEQFGWNRSFEALVARIVADHAAGRSPGREAAWIAEVDGRRAGSVCCVADDEDQEAARLRLLLVLPSARGLGIGTRLVGECLRFAEETGYRRITLWTTDVLVSARRIYQAAGFELVDQEPHRGFGPEVMGQNRRRDL
ncbi:GNAT family N-acetyltransferase [Actinomadura viridis]|uniref:GNAT family N-acetyltransferase n=1 Tax=Actinomadura viridis TaxID=58110 RepID=UPI0036907281